MMARAAGAAKELPFDQPPTGSWMKPSNDPSGLYSAAVHQQGGDYDSIMGNYKTLFGQAQDTRNRPDVAYNPLSRTNVGYTPISPYSPSAGMSDLTGRLRTNADTGGYSQEELSTLRARGISPIRAIYANALRNLQKQKNLSGGYAPNYGALQAKMAREQSMQIGEQTTRVNADIADRVASGRQSALSQLSPLVSQQDQATTNINTANAQGTQRVNELNSAENARIEQMNRANSANSINQSLQANQGMQSLYGTTPALTNMFGQQVLASNAQNMQGQIAASNAAQDRANTGLSLVSNPNVWRLGSMSRR
jgi:hypothetical protein